MPIGHGWKPSWSARARTQIVMPTMPPTWSRFGMNWIASARITGLWREEADREHARTANMQTNAEHTEHELARLQAELEQARRTGKGAAALVATADRAVSSARHRNAPCF